MNTSVLAILTSILSIVYGLFTLFAFSEGSYGNTIKSATICGAISAGLAVVSIYLWISYVRWRRKIRSNTAVSTAKS